VVLSGAMDPVRSPEVRGVEGLAVNRLRRNSGTGAETRRNYERFPVVHLAEFMEALYTPCVRQWT